MHIDGHSRNKKNKTTKDKLDPQEHREFRSGAGICQYMTEQRFDIAFIQYEGNHERGSRTDHRYLKGRQRCVLNFPWVGKLDDVIHVTLDADWLETQRQGAPCLVECCQSARDSQFDIGL